MNDIYLTSALVVAIKVNKSIILPREVNWWESQRETQGRYLELIPVTEADHIQKGWIKIKLIALVAFDKNICLDMRSSVYLEDVLSANADQLCI